MSTQLEERKEELRKETIQLNARLNTQMSIEDAVQDFDDSVLENYVKVQFHFLGINSDIDVEIANRNTLIEYMKQVKWERLRSALNRKGTNVPSEKQKQAFERLYDKALLLGYDETHEPKDKVDFMEAMDKITAFLDIANRIGNITIDQHNRLKSLYKLMGKEDEFSLAKYENKEQASNEIGLLIEALNDKAKTEVATEKQVDTIQKLLKSLGKRFTAKHRALTKHDAKVFISELYEESSKLPATDKQLGYMHRLADMAMTVLEDEVITKSECSNKIAELQRTIISAYGNYTDRQLEAMSDRQVSTTFSKIQSEQQTIYQDIENGVEQ